MKLKHPKAVCALPVDPDSDVVLEKLGDDRQHRCGAVSPSSQDVTEKKSNIFVSVRNIVVYINATS